MADVTEFSDIIAQLRRHRAEAVARVEALDAAIAELMRASGDDVPAAAPSAGEPRRRAPRGQGVKQHVIDFVSASDRDWDAHELHQEFVRRGYSLEVEDPLNAIRSALSRGTKAGRLVRTGFGRYGSPDHIDQKEVSAPPDKGVEEPAPLPTG